jgi:hypothetical protein
VPARELVHALADRLRLLGGQVGALRVEALVVRQQLRPVAPERREEVLLRAGLEVEEVATGRSATVNL